MKTIVTTTIVSRHDSLRLIQFPLEVDADSMADLHRELIVSGAIHGVRVIFDVLKDGRRLVRDRQPQILTLAGIAAIAPCPYEYFETDEVGTDE